MESFKQLSRRDFLKLAASSALGLALSELRLDRAFAAPPASQGRVTWSGVPLYDAPSFKAKEIRVFGMDQVVAITAEMEGDEGYGNPYNKIWYQVDNGIPIRAGSNLWKLVSRKRFLIFLRRVNWVRSLSPLAKRGLCLIPSPITAIGYITA